MEDFITRAEHNEYVKRMEDEHKRLNNRLSTVENTTKDMQELVKNVGIMATNMEHMVDEQRNQSDRLERLEEAPLNSLYTVKNGIYNAIGASIGGAIVAAILFFF